MGCRTEVSPSVKIRENGLRYLLKTCVPAGNLLLQQGIASDNTQDFDQILILCPNAFTLVVLFFFPMVKLLLLQLLLLGYDRSQNKVFIIIYQLFYIPKFSHWKQGMVMLLSTFQKILNIIKNTIFQIFFP